MNPDVATASRALGRANEALRKAEDARDGARAVYDALGQIARELAGLRAATNEGFARLAWDIGQLRRQHRTSQADIKELEDSQVKSLRKELRDAKENAQWWRRWLLGIVAFVVGGMILGWIMAQKR